MLSQPALRASVAAPRIVHMTPVERRVRTNSSASTIAGWHDQPRYNPKDEKVRKTITIPAPKTEMPIQRVRCLARVIRLKANGQPGKQIGRRGHARRPCK